MPAASNDHAAKQVTVGFAVEFSIEEPSEGTDFDAVTYCANLLHDAIAGWGVAVVRIAHLSDPDKVFAGK